MIKAQILIGAQRWGRERRLQVNLDIWNASKKQSQETNPIRCHCTILELVFPIIIVLSPQSQATIITITTRCALRCSSTAAAGAECNAFNFNPESKVVPAIRRMVESFWQWKWLGRPRPWQCAAGVLDWQRRVSYSLTSHRPEGGLGQVGQEARWPDGSGGQVTRLVRWPGGQVGPKVPRLKKVLCSTITWPPNGIRPGYGWFAVDNNIEGSFNQANIFCQINSCSC